MCRLPSSSLTRFRRSLLLVSFALSWACSGGGGAGGAEVVADGSGDAPPSPADSQTDALRGADAPGADLPSADTAEVVPDVMPLGCLDPLAGVAVGAGDAIPDPAEYPPDDAFLAQVDDLFAKAAVAPTPVTLSREGFLVYDFKPEDSPRGRLAWESRIRHGHFDVTSYLEGFRSQLEQSQGDASVLLSFLSDKIDSYVPPDSVEPFVGRAQMLAAQPGALGCALEAVGSLDPDREPGGAGGVDPTLLALPDPVQQDLAQFLFLAYFARLLQEDAMAECAASIPLDDVLYAYSVLPTFEAMAAPGGLEECGSGVDFRQLVRGAQVAVNAASALADAAESWDPKTSVEAETGLGRIRIAGDADTTHAQSQGDFLLVLDLGGNDSYVDGMATSRPGLPIAILIDLAGDDTYQTKGADPAFAAGFLGYGILLDRAGNDTYAGRYDGVGAACLGVAVLEDDAGDDLYDSIEGVQASAHLGVALLLDKGGKDHYYSFRSSQGFGSYLGAGLLLDLSGDDIYEAEDDLVLYPAAQNPSYNGNMSQGAGFGFRNDAVPFPETYSGGFGMLADLQGNDTYSAGIFAQAVGYWFGVGFLVDAAGNDTYSGVWYNQGAAAHFAGGAQLDAAGDDSYYCFQDQCAGEGRDYSIGVLIEMSGNDEYYCKGGRNIGSGDLFGSGILWDAEGTDSYQDDTPWAVGFVTTETYVENSFTFGMFIDSGGTSDTYTLPDDHAADNSVWTQVGNNNDGQFANVVAVGADQ